MNTYNISEKIVKTLFDDLSDRNGFDLGNIDNKIIKEWKKEWKSKVQLILRKAQAKDFKEDPK